MSYTDLVDKFGESCARALVGAEHADEESRVAEILAENEIPHALGAAILNDQGAISTILSEIEGT